VCRDLGFPAFVLERSPLVLRDIELIKAINAAYAAVQQEGLAFSCRLMYSIIACCASKSSSRSNQEEKS